MKAAVSELRCHQKAVPGSSPEIPGEEPLAGPQRDVSHTRGVNKGHKRGVNKGGAPSCNRGTRASSSRHVRFQFALFSSAHVLRHLVPLIPHLYSPTKLRPITPYSLPSKTPSKTSLKTVFPSTIPSVNGGSDMPYVCSYRPLLRRTISVNPFAAACHLQEEQYLVARGWLGFDEKPRDGRRRNSSRRRGGEFRLCREGTGGCGES